MTIVSRNLPDIFILGSVVSRKCELIARFNEFIRNGLIRTGQASDDIFAS